VQSHVASPLAGNVPEAMWDGRGVALVPCGTARPYTAPHRLASIPGGCDHPAMRPMIFALACTLAAPVQSDCATDAMLVFDGSASMAEIGFNAGAPTRIEEARAAVARAMPLVEPFRRIGLMTYGPGGDTSCSGLNVHFPPMDRAAAATIAGVEALSPDGLTPLAASVEVAAELLNYRTDPAIVVLVTDGNETCGGRPCSLSNRLANQAADLTIHVIGFRGEGNVFFWNNPEQERFAADTVAKCLSDRTGGLFVSTETVDDLVAALQRTLGCPLTGQGPRRMRPT
ncbi:MAG: VWA domain-containing protein, partial [Pseudomonadota bacterium]